MQQQEGKVTKKPRRRGRRIIVGLLTALLLLLASLATPRIQLEIARELLTQFATTLGTNISVDRIRVSIFNDSSIEGLLLHDQQGDTLLYVNRVELDVKKFGLRESELIFNEVLLSGAYLKTYQLPNGIWSQSFILDSLAGGEGGTTDYYVELKEVNLKGLKYTRHDTSSFAESGFDFNHLNTQLISVKVTDFTAVPDQIEFKVRHAAGHDQSGAFLKQIEAKYHQSNDQIKIKLGALDVNNSQCSGAIELNSKPDQPIKFRLNDGQLKGQDLVFFTGLSWLNQFDGSMRVAGEYWADSLQIDQAKVKTEGFIVDLGGAFKVIDSSFVDLMSIRVKELKMDQFWMRTIGEVVYGSNPIEGIPQLSEMGYQGKFAKNGMVIHSRGDLVTNLGFLGHNLKLKMDSIPVYAGQIKARAVQLDVLSGDPRFGIANADFTINGQGMTSAQLDADVDGTILGIGYDGHNFRNIQLDGLVKEELFKGVVTIRDPLLDLDFDGKIDWSGKQFEIESYANLHYVDAKPFRAFVGDSIGSLSAIVDINMKGRTFEQLQGEVYITNLSVAVGKRSLDMDKMAFTAYRKNDQRMVQLQSDFLSGLVQGDFVTTDLIAALSGQIGSVIPAFYKAERKDAPEMSVKYQLGSRNFQPLLEWLDPTLECPTFSISGNYNGNGVGQVEFQAASISKGKFSGEDITLFGWLAADTMDFELNVERVLTDTVFRSEVQLDATIHNNFVIADLNWDDLDAVTAYRGDLHGTVDLLNDRQFAIEVSSVEAVMADTLWSSTDTLRFLVDSGNVQVEEYHLHTTNQSIGVQGAYGNNKDNAIRLIFENVNLGDVGHLMNDTLMLAGAVDGNVDVSMIDEKYELSSDIVLSSFEVNGTGIGTVDLDAQWNSAQDAVALNCGIRDSVGKTIIGVTGKLYTDKQVKDLDIIVDFAGLPLSWLNLIPTEGVRNFSGDIYGDLSVSGRFASPVVKGEVSVDGLQLTIEELNTSYTIANADLIVTEDFVRLRPSDLIDQNGSISKIKGDVRHNAFNDVRYRIQIEANHLLALDKPWAIGSSYYGTAIVTGPINIKGTPSELNIEGSPKTEQGTALFLPLGHVEEVADHNFITFKKPPSEAIKEVKPKQFSRFGVNLLLNVEVTTDAQIQMVFDQTVGDIIKANGSGDIRMEIKASGDFKMYGEYVINDGDYLFNLENLINKRFAVDAGSTVTWDGDPLGAIINLRAIYKLRAPLVDIMPYVDEQTSAAYSKRVPVLVNLQLTNQLLEPDITFRVELPSVDQETRDVFNAMLNTEHEINSQVFALLLLQRFLPDQDQRRDGSVATIGGRSSSEMLSNQVSNWLSQISQDFDVGVNYRPGDKVSTDEFEFAVSTQLFNDRVTIDGNLGNNGANADETTSDIVGDFNIEYKISKDGRFRAKVYNQSNDFNLAQQQTGKYTQGAGLFYRVEFGKLFGKKNQKANK